MKAGKPFTRKDHEEFARILNAEYIAMLVVRQCFRDKEIRAEAKDIIFHAHRLRFALERRFFDSSSPVSGSPYFPVPEKIRERKK